MATLGHLLLGHLCQTSDYSTLFVINHPQMMVGNFSFLVTFFSEQTLATCVLAVAGVSCN